MKNKFNIKDKKKGKNILEMKSNSKEKIVNSNEK